MVKNNMATYVVMTEEQYKELVQFEQEACRQRVKAALNDVRKGKVKRGKAEKILKDLGLE